MRRLSLCLTLWALALGCDRPSELDRALAPAGPFGLRHHVAWVLGGPRALLLLDPTTAARRRVPLPAAPTQTLPEPGGRGLLVLDEAGATWAPVGSGGAGALIRFELSGRYGEATFGPDARRVVLHHSPLTTGGAHLENPNQIALLDLETGGVVERTLRSYGSAPKRVVVAARGPLGGVDRQLAWMLADRYLALIDLSAPEATEVVVHLTLETDAGEVSPAQVVTDEVEGVPMAFVRALGASDLYALSFPDEAPADEVPRPYLNQLSAGPTPSDVVVLHVHDGPRVFVVDRASRVLSVIHPVTGRRVQVPVNLPVQHIVPFAAPREDLFEDQRPGAVGQFALLWAEGSPAVVFVDLDRAERRGGRSLTVVNLGAGLTTVRPIPGRHGAIAELGGRAVALIDFEARTATPLTTDGALSDLQLAADGAAAYMGLRAGGDFAVVTLETDTGAVLDTPIPAGAGRVLLVPEANRLVVVHPSPWGHVSLVRGESVHELEGLFLEGVLDR